MAKAEKYKNAGHKALEKGQYKKALESFQKAFNEEPGDLDLLLRMADITNRLGDKPSAISLYQEVAEKYSLKGYSLKAVAVYKVLLSLDGQNILYTEQLASLYESLQLTNEAQANYGTLVDHYEKEGDSQKMESYLFKLVSSCPQDTNSVKKFLDLLCEKDRRDEAILEVKEVLEVLKTKNLINEYSIVSEYYLSLENDFNSLLELSEIYINQGKFHNALNKLHKGYLDHKSNPMLLKLLYRVFEETRQVEKSLPVLKELVRILKKEDGNDEEFEHYSKKYELITGKEIDMDLAESTSKPGNLPPKPKTAPPSSEQSSEPVSIENYEKLMVETDVYIKYGLLDKAVEHLEAIEESYRTEWRHKDALVNILISQGELGKATSALEILIERLIALSEFNEAQKKCKKLQNLDPNNEKLKMQLANLEEAQNITETELLDEEIIADEDDFIDLGQPQGGQVHSIEMKNIELESVHHDLDEELEMVEFFFQQGMLDEAHQKLLNLKNYFSDYRITKLIKQIEGGGDNPELNIVPATIEETFSRNDDEEELIPYDSSHEVVRELSHRMDLAKSCMALNLVGKAHEILTQIHRSGSDNSEFFELFAKSFELKGDYGNSIKYLKSSLNFNNLPLSRQVCIYYKIGGIYEKIGDQSEALYYYKMVFSRLPNYADIQDKISHLGG